MNARCPCKPFLVWPGPSKAQACAGLPVSDNARAGRRHCPRTPGDKFWTDEDDYYWYAGRSDDMFRVSGQWVSPAEVESALIEHECVLEAAVVAYREPTELFTPKAFVVPRDGVLASPELARALQEFVKNRITPYKYPRHIEFVSTLPKSAAGKLLRYKLRELASGTSNF